MPLIRWPGNSRINGVAFNVHTILSPRKRWFLIITRQEEASRLGLRILRYVHGSTVKRSLRITPPGGINAFVPVNAVRNSGIGRIGSLKPTQNPKPDSYITSKKEELSHHSLPSALLIACSNCLINGLPC